MKHDHLSNQLTDHIPDMSGCITYAIWKQPKTALIPCRQNKTFCVMEHSVASPISVRICASYKRSSPTPLESFITRLRTSMSPTEVAPARRKPLSTTSMLG